MSLPCKLPLLLMMGAEGIAVGLSTRILPHNFGELLDAQVAILQKKPFEVLPDFRQGGLMDASEYDRGKGSVRVRAEIEPRVEGDKAEMVIRSVPFGTTTDSLIASIEAAAKKKKLAVKSIDDFTAEEVEIRVVLKPGQDAHKALHALYAFTQCEVALSSRIVVIHKNRPVEMDVEGVLRHNTRTLVTTLRRELESERRKHLDKIHQKSLVRIFVEQRIYKRIEECKTFPEVQQAVLDGVNRFRNLLERDVTHKDVEMLLGIKIKRISRYDMERNRREIADLTAAVEGIDASLADIVAPHDPLPALDLAQVREGPPAAHTDRRRLRQHRRARPDRERADPALRRRQGLPGPRDPGRRAVPVLLAGQAARAARRRAVQGDEPAREALRRSRHAPGAARPTATVSSSWSTARKTACSTSSASPSAGRSSTGSTRAFPPAPGIELFSADDPERLYVRYTDGGGQLFNLEKVKPRSVKAQGWLLTSKPVKSLAVERPEDWSDKRFGRARVPLGMAK